jgi:LuxR family maltose regulon positive regulatory protein
MRLHPMFEFVYIIYARLLLNQPQPDPAGALQLLDNLEQLSRSSGHGRVLIIVHILQALAHAALGQERQALGCLGQAIELAAPQGYRRFFLDEGPGVAELLPHLRQLAPEFVSELLVAFGQEPAARLAGPELADTLPSPGEFEPVEALSDRELELLELVATGKSNSEIAADLFITVGTVKKHLNNIFGKLAVKNRTEAVARAREWRLVP